jgi:N-formylglutamate deformylase
VEPFVIQRPLVPSALLYDSPHSGRFYPPDFESNASRLELRRGEDAYIDQLLGNTPSLGAYLLVANYPRCYIDLNRDETDIDAALLSEPWPTPLRPTEKSARGLGLIRRYVVPGVEVQARPLTVQAVRHRIEQVYRPYHASLDALVAEIHATQGVVWHVDWHSMKSVGNAMTPDGPGARRADFVVSNAREASASKEVTDIIVRYLRGVGHTVSVNDPYLGGVIVRRTGSPSRGIHSVQIEVNRALYMDEQLVETTSSAGLLASTIDGLTRVLVAAPNRG